MTSRLSKDKPLARSLYAAVEVERPIPTEFYRAVAESCASSSRGNQDGPSDDSEPWHFRTELPGAAQRPKERISELRLIDASELILLIRNYQTANIADIVNSSTRLFLKSGALRYSLRELWRALGWDVRRRDGLEFRYAMVAAFFRLAIGERQTGSIIDILFDERVLDERAEVTRPSEAFASARLTPDDRPSTCVPWRRA